MSKLELTSLDLEEDTVVVTNNYPRKKVNMTGWALQSLTGDQQYDFPEDLVLGGGESVKIWSGRGSDAKAEAEGDLHWTNRFMWNNKGDTAVLVNEEGEEVSRLAAGADAESALAISKLDLKEDTVTIVNTGDEDVDMAGWTLQSLTGDQQYEFPDVFVLGVGESIKIWSGRGSDAKAQAEGDLHWTNRFMWNDKGDTAVLVNAAGTAVSTVEEAGLPRTPSPRKSSRRSSKRKTPARKMEDDDDDEEEEEEEAEEEKEHTQVATTSRRRERRPYTKKVKVAVWVDKTVPVTKQVAVTTKKLVERQVEEEVEEQYTEMVEEEAVRTRTVWVQKQVQETYTKQVPVTRTRMVKRVTTKLEEVPMEHIVEVESSEVQRVKGYRVDEIKGWRWVEVEEAENMMVVPVGSMREQVIGEVPMPEEDEEDHGETRDMGARAWYADDQDLDFDLNSVEVDNAPVEVQQRGVLGVN